MEDCFKRWRDIHEKNVAKRRAQGEAEYAHRCAQTKLEIDAKTDKDVQEMDALYSKREQEVRKAIATNGLETNSGSTSKQADAVSAQLRPEAETALVLWQSNGTVALSPPPANYFGRANREGRPTAATDRGTMISDSSSPFGTFLPNELPYASSDVERDTYTSSGTNSRALGAFSSAECSTCDTPASSLFTNIHQTIDPRILTAPVQPGNLSGSGASYTADDLQSEPWGWKPHRL
jgi:hypothetical protein